MPKTKRLVFMMAAIVLSLGMAGVSVAAQAKTPAPVQGSLVAVDVDAKMITVRTADNQNVQFQYNDETKVTGAQENVAGLATAKDQRVTVTFREQGAARIATQIEVVPAKK